ncbi:MAG: DUF4835 family protein [Bacteroidota bacterium]
MSYIKSRAQIFVFVFAYCLLPTAYFSSAQELNCQVSVLTPQIQESNKTIFETLQSQIRDFMNNRKWTGDAYDNAERIECSMIINVTERVSTEDFKATIQIQSRRPVYKTSYNSPMINHQDNDFNFHYVQDQVLDFDENSLSANLTATLAYYAYIIIGLDYDSYSADGGTPYFLKAQTIVNNAQSLGERGWKAFESQRNRYWLVENILNVQFRPMRSCMYKYHRLGFDKMNDNVNESRLTILEALKPLRTVYNDRPNSFFMQFFFNAKADELVSLYQMGTPDEKTQVTQLLTQIDPGNISKYNTIATGK